MPSFVRKILMCWPGFCGMVTTGDDKYLWGECPSCGKRAGVVSREAIRRYMEAEERWKESKQILEAERRQIIEGQRSR